VLYWIDSEFDERGGGHPIIPISIGIVAEDGRELYLVSSEFDESAVNDFVRENVLPELGDEPRITLAEMKDRVLEFLGGDDDPQFWAYFGAYDWVVFAQLFGTMADMPDFLPWFCNDLATLAGLVGATKDDLPPDPEEGEHNALVDAQWDRDCYAVLMAMAEGDDDDEPPEDESPATGTDGEA